MSFFEEFPRPIGSYVVGRRQMDFRFTASDGSARELTAFFFYPSDCSEDKPTAEYVFPELPSLRAELLETIGSPTDEQFFVPMKTGCYEDLAVSEKQERYPVLFYNHGGGSFPQMGTVVCQDLASVGYIVVSVGHPASGAFKFRDGRISPFSQEFMEGTKTYGWDFATRILPMMEIVATKLDQDRAIEVSRELTAAPEAVRFSRFGDAQRENIQYVADCLTKMDRGEMESIFAGRLQLDIGLGVFGHSFGGTTAAIVCRDDDRFVCGVNYDGNMVGALDSDLGKPFLQLCTVLAYNTNAFLLETNSKPTTFVVIDQAHHYDFGDSLFSVHNPAYQGGRDPLEMRDMITTYTKTFFDQYLLHNGDGIEDLNFEGTEVIKGAM